MRKILTGILLVIVVDAFYFDVALRILPAVNSKMVLAVIGVIAFIFKGLQEKKLQFSRRILISALLAIAFSLWCYYSITANGTDQKEYVTYFVSFATWLGGAYGVTVSFEGLGAFRPTGIVVSEPAEESRLFEPTLRLGLPML